MSEVENVRRFNSYNLSNENITYILLNKCCYEKMRLESFETTNSESMTDLVCSWKFIQTRPIVQLSTT
jgi:hypothetical protein